MTLVDLHARLSNVYDAIHAFDVPISHPPIIDLASSHEHVHDREDLPGLRFLRDEVKRDREILDKFFREASNEPVTPSVNAPYLIAVWDELVHARQPVAIYRMFSPADRQDKARRHGTTKTTRNGKNGTRAVKVDVVAENGAKWVRVNTIKNARLMMEFREIDSYLTSDEDDNEDEPQPRLVKFDNSVLRMGRELLAAAKANPVSIPAPFSSLVPDSNSITPCPDTTMTPQVTIRFTRLDPFLQDGTTDPRIEKTIQYLRDMGIDVQLGERLSYPHSLPIPKASTEPKLLVPTTNINLDLSALIALISDISHAPLPRTEQEAYTRFEPPQSYLDWKRDREKLLVPQNQGTRHTLCDAEDDDGGWENSGLHSRALAAQAIQEMSKGILEEIHERISVVVTCSSMPPTGVTFWTTSEARHRCLQIVSKIGGEQERKRADALLDSRCCARVPPVPAPVHASGGISDVAPAMDDDVGGKASPDAYWEHSRYPAGFLPLVPVRVYPSTLPAVEDRDRLSRSTFVDALVWTCARILSHETTGSVVSAPPDRFPTATDKVLDEIPPAPHTSLPKLTVHTVTSMLAGASRGYTTLTTNKSSVKAVLKEMRRVCGIVHEPDVEVQDVEKAALWILGPRSLSEGMRSE